jgi:hypothetical protein
MKKVKTKSFRLEIPNDVHQRLGIEALVLDTTKQKLINKILKTYVGTKRSKK